MCHRSCESLVRHCVVFLVARAAVPRHSGNSLQREMMLNAGSAAARPIRDRSCRDPLSPKSLAFISL